MSGHPLHSVASPRPVVGLTHIVCGIDGSPEAIEAVREAAVLAPAAGGSIVLAAAVLPGFVEGLATVVPGVTADPEERARIEAAWQLDRAREVVGDRVPTIVSMHSGHPAAVLEAEVRHMQTDAIAVGSHGKGRVSGVVLGSVATRLIHRAQCSVLVARADAERPFPASIAVGVDGAESSRRAFALAEGLAARLDVPLRALHLADGHDTSALADDLGFEVEEIHQHVTPADALCARVADVDLLVIGSRGLRGVRALGSVSEAVAHHSPSSVLIVR